MKKLFISLLAIGAALTSSAQADLFDNPDNHPYFGARVSLDITSAAGGNKGWYDNGAGFSFGAIYNIPLYKNLYFEPGLSVFYNTIGEKFYLDTTREMIKGSIRNFGFRIPLVAGYHFDFTDDMQLHVFTGPQINWSVIAKEHINDMSQSLFGDKGFNHFDLQWALGVGLSWQQYYISLSGGIGITKAKDFNIGVKDQFRRNNFSIALGYNF